MFALSPASRLLRQLLRRTAVGATVTYADLSAEAGQEVDGGTSCLQAARAYLVRHDRIAFGTLRGVGLQRLADNEIVAHSDRGADRIRRAARREAGKIVCVADYAGLTLQQQIAHTTRLSIFTATAEMNSDRGFKAVSSVAGGRAAELPIAETLRAFSK